MIKSILKTHPVILNCAVSLYNLFHWNNSCFFRLKNDFTLKGVFLKKCRFSIKGKNNKINIEPMARLNNCCFTIIGNNCEIQIGGRHTIISNVHFWCQDDNSKVFIGKDFTMEGGHIASTEGKTITIGEDCMFASNIEIRNGDSHSIIDTNTGKRINYAEDVVIGSHVWLTSFVKVLKGSVIPNNSIVGNSSVVSHKFQTENGLYAGIPAKLIKESVIFNRYKI